MYMRPILTGKGDAYWIDNRERQRGWLGATSEKTKQNKKPYDNNNNSNNKK